MSYSINKIYKLCVLLVASIVLFACAESGSENPENNEVGSDPTVEQGDSEQGDDNQSEPDSEQEPEPDLEPEPEPDPEPVPEPTEDDPFQEQNGLVVIELESTKYPNSWEFVAGEQALGEGYIQWTEYSAYQQSGTGQIDIDVEIHTPGTYRVMWRNSIRKGTSPSDHNDTWLKILAPNFYGMKLDQSSTVCPRQQELSNLCVGEPPEGSSSAGALKVYRFGTPASDWVWHSYTSDNNAHGIFADFDEAGVYQVQVSARSTFHGLDRLVLFRSHNTDNNVSETFATSSTREASPRAVMTTSIWEPEIVAVEPDDEQNPIDMASAFDVVVTPNNDELTQVSELEISASPVNSIVTTQAELFINGNSINTIEGAGPYNWTSLSTPAITELLAGRPEIKVELTADNGDIGYSFAQVRIDGDIGGTYVHAFNLGGDDYVAQDGQLFVGAFWTGLETNNEIAGTRDDELYQKQLSKAGWTALHNDGVLGELTLAAGETYQVDYHFAEIEHDSAGQRAIDIHNNSAKIANALDVYARAGKDEAYVMSIIFTAGSDAKYVTGFETNGAESWDTSSAMAAFAIRKLDQYAWGDEDNDGVYNFDDQCPNSAQDANVDSEGCEVINN